MIELRMHYTPKQNRYATQKYTSRVYWLFWEIATVGVYLESYVFLREINIYRGNLHCVFVWLCARSLEWGAWICVSVETRGWCQLPFKIFLHIIIFNNNVIIIILKQSPSMNLELIYSARVAEQQTQGSFCVLLLCVGLQALAFKGV